MLALIAESSCTQVKKQGKKHKFKKPMQQRENHSKKLKDEPFHSKLSEKFANIRTWLLMLWEKLRQSITKSEFEEAISVPNGKWKLINRIIPEGCGFARM